MANSFKDWSVNKELLKTIFFGWIISEEISPKYEKMWEKLTKIAFLSFAKFCTQYFAKYYFALGSAKCEISRNFVHCSHNSIKYVYGSKFAFWDPETQVQGHKLYTLILFYKQQMILLTSQFLS